MATITEEELPQKLQLRPSYKFKFNPSKVRDIIKPILKETFKNVETYQSEQVANITKDLANTVRDKLQDSPELQYDRYKFVVNVLIGEQRGEGVKFACRCFWDEETDNYVSEVFMNFNAICEWWGTYNVHKYCQYTYEVFRCCSCTY